MSNENHDQRSLRLALVFKCISIGANALCAGGVFTLPLLSPELASRLKFNQVQLTTIILAGIVGQYPLTPVVGRIVDKFGPQTCSLVAGVLYSLSFGGIGIEISHTQDSLRHPSIWSFRLVTTYCLLAGFATVFSYYSSLFAASKTFPQYIGISSGASMALFALSPLFLTTIASQYFSSDAGNLDSAMYMLFLAVLTGVVHLAGTLTLRMPITDGHLERNQLIVDENTTLLHGPSNPSTSRGVRIPSPRFPLKDSSFWLLSLFCLFTLGADEMVISNIGTIIIALPSERSPSPSAPNSAAQQVQLISISNTMLRIVTGITADFVSPAASSINGKAIFLKKHFVSRLLFLSLPSLLLALTFLCTASIARTRADAWVLSLGVGMSYGTIFTVLPSIVAAIWGIDNLGRNFGILMMAPFVGTTIFSYLYAFVSQAHTSADGICIGRSCWMMSFWISGGTSFIAFGLSVVLWLRWRGRL